MKSITDLGRGGKIKKFEHFLSYKFNFSVFEQIKELLDCKFRFTMQAASVCAVFVLGDYSGTAVLIFILHFSTLMNES